VIGARMPLIAFNVNLNTPRLDVAKAVAKAVRHSSGGLPFVKALGVPIAERGLTQVSMNLTNYEQTPILQAFEAVRTEAIRHGVAVADSEIVGLVPAAALAHTSPAALRLTGFTDAQILEHRIRQL
jgi:glutamate formiminotransferase